MRKIIIVIIVVLLVAIGAFFVFLKWGSGSSATLQNATSPGLPVSEQPITSARTSLPAALSQATLFLGDATISGADISSTMPSDAPQGAIIQFQTASDTISLKNFYLGAQGYWFDLDAILLQYTSSYVIWYYRGISGFIIVLPEDGENQDAAEVALANDLGVSRQELCSLPITVEYVFDRGNSSEELPLLSCPQQAL